MQKNNKINKKNEFLYYPKKNFLNSKKIKMIDNILYTNEKTFLTKLNYIYKPKYDKYKLLYIMYNKLTLIVQDYIIHIVFQIILTIYVIFILLQMLQVKEKVELEYYHILI